MRSIQHWVETVVVDLNLCPFAQRELRLNRVRFVVADAVTEQALLSCLEEELDRLDNEASVETTLLIHPNVLLDFIDYNNFLGSADALLARTDREGVYQIASFHPDYQFAGTAPSAAENYTNRSPYPVLHLLREVSLERAIADYPDVDQIPQRNIERMNNLGTTALQQLLKICCSQPSL